MANTDISNATLISSNTTTFDHNGPFVQLITCDQATKEPDIAQTVSCIETLNCESMRKLIQNKIKPEMTSVPRRIGTMANNQVGAGSLRICFGNSPPIFSLD